MRAELKNANKTLAGRGHRTTSQVPATPSVEGSGKQLGLARVPCRWFLVMVGAELLWSRGRVARSEPP